MNNKNIGNKFENELAEKLSKKGYWVTLLTPKAHIGSQPADLIATKNNIFYAFECKTLHGKYKRFPIKRLEQNQILAYKKLKEVGSNNYFLVVKWNNEIIYLIPFTEIDLNQKSILLEDKYKI